MASEMVIALVGLAGAVVGGGISSLTAFTIARSEREKYRRERSWDLRREAYTKIIGALDRARLITVHINNGYDDNPHAWDASKANRNAAKEMVQHFHVARAEFHANRLMLSPAFVAGYDKMNFELGEADNPNLLPPESAAFAAEVMSRSVASQKRWRRKN